MNIAIIGYGKMGKAIEKIAGERNHQIVLKIGIDNQEDFNKENIAKADVAIEFSTPSAAYDNVKKCLGAEIPTVCGTTAWTGHLPEVKDWVLKEGLSFLYASNFSVGVNIFFEVNKRLAALMAHQPQYEITMEEIHHTQKKDAPSGTAITLAEQVLKEIPRKTKWINEATDEPEALSIISKRIDTTPGTHTVNYSSEVDEIQIKHTAHSRAGFALGAVLAAEYIVDKKGFFTMKEVLGL